MGKRLLRAPRDPRSRAVAGRILAGTIPSRHILIFCTALLTPAVFFDEHGGLPHPCFSDTC
jgi:hypothetical protein